MEDRTFWMWISILSILLVLVISLAVHTGKAYSNACKEIGLEKYKSISNMHYCEDSEENLHYIKVDCVFPLFTKCVFKPISVGNVRIKGG